MKKEYRKNNELNLKIENIEKTRHFKIVRLKELVEAFKNLGYFKVECDGVNYIQFNRYDEYIGFDFVNRKTYSNMNRYTIQEKKLVVLMENIM